MRAPHPKSQNAPEHKVAGRNACRALFSVRPDDIRRVYITEDALPAFKDVLKFCAEHRVAYHVKTDLDLDAVADTPHHDGVLFLARARQEGAVDDVVAWAKRAERGHVLLVEDVKNPHNLGAILRVCSHFGVSFCLRAGDTAPLSPAVLRTAEGGAEHCSLVDVGDGKAILQVLRDCGFSVLATSSHARHTLGAATLPPKSVVLFGSEGRGLSPMLSRAADSVVAIPGSGALESLNVACAASILLWELWKSSAPSAVVPSREPPNVPKQKQQPPPSPSSPSSHRRRRR